MRAGVPGQRRALTLIAIGQLLALSLWFSASAVAPQLREVWDLSGVAETGLTFAVQVGFVTGALVSAVLNIADVVRSRHLFFISAAGGAVVNLALVLVGPDSVSLAIGLRFMTGVFLAGLYPAGLKVMSGWFASGRGMALGVLVGALTIGSASPHLLRGVGLEWEGVVVASSALTIVSGLLMLGVGDGPFEIPVQPFRWRQVADVFANRGFRLATYGYLGHMWELYAMWTWVAGFLAASAVAFGGGYPPISLLTFLIIASGGLGSWWAGVTADRIGRTRVAGTALAISGTCAILTPLFFGLSPWIVVPVMIVWGVTVVADSAQFSTMVTETASHGTRGTALTLQTALGFLLTLVTISAVPAIADMSSWRWAFIGLSLGPAFGLWAMVRLARSPMSADLAGGRG